MKKLFTFLFIVSICFFSCSTDYPQEIEKIEETQISMFVPDFEFQSSSSMDSRTSIDITDDGGIFKWGQNDTVGIFPDRGAQTYFPMEQGAGTNTAVFDGGGWALKPSSSYMAYYPFIGDIFQDKKCIPVNYEARQDQKGDSPDHLAKFDYLAAKTVTPVDGKVNFDFKHLGCLVQIDLSARFTSRFSDVKISIDDKEFITKGVVDLTAEIPSINAVDLSDTIVASFSKEYRLDNHCPFKTYFMIAPVDLSGKRIKVEVGGHRGYIDGVNLLPGKAYRFSVNWEQEPPLHPAMPASVEWVDLGLSVLWASHNVGAQKPEEYGDLFAWGEVAAKYEYTEANCYSDRFQINDFSGNSNYDAATAFWGESACLPTLTEMQELYNNCTFTFTNLNGVSGAWVTSKKNGEKIFLPRMNDRIWTFYWTSTPYEVDGYYQAWILLVTDDPWVPEDSKVGWTLRSTSCMIRPVRHK